MTKIEKVLSCTAGTDPLFLAHFLFVAGRVRLVLKTMPDDPATPPTEVQASFLNAVIESIEEDEDDRDSWPLDMVGFDCYPQGEKWRFVLVCVGVEWCWHSDWPTLKP